MSKKPKQKNQPPSLEQAATSGRQSAPPPEVHPDPNFKTEYLNEHGQNPAQLADQLSRRDSRNMPPQMKTGTEQVMPPTPEQASTPTFVGVDLVSGPDKTAIVGRTAESQSSSSMMPGSPDYQSTQTPTHVVSTDLPNTNKNSTPDSLETSPELLLDLEDDDAEEIVHVDPELQTLLAYMHSNRFLADEMDNVLGSLMQMPFGIPVFDQWDIEATPTQILQDVEQMCKSSGYICEKWPAIKILLAHEAQDEHWACRLLIIFAFMDLVSSL